MELLKEKDTISKKKLFFLGAFILVITAIICSPKRVVVIPIGNLYINGNVPKAKEEKNP